MLGCFCPFQKIAQSKQSSNRKKFAQSGRPAKAHLGTRATNGMPSVCAGTVNYVFASIWGRIYKCPILPKKFSPQIFIPEQWIQFH
jgi:hypothetical protein